MHHRRNSQQAHQVTDQPEQGHPERRILVDAANVAFTNRNQPNAKGCVENLRVMRSALVGLGYHPTFIADASLKFEVDDPEALNQLEQDGRILQAPAGTQADYFLLADARRENLPIVSNDAFRDRQAEFPDAFERRVPFMIVDGRVILDFENVSHLESASK